MVILRFLRTLFGIYGLLWFGVQILVGAPVAMFLLAFFPGERGRELTHRWARIWAIGFEIFLFLPMKIRNKELIDPRETYVFVANHQSQLDIPLYLRSCSNSFKFLAKAELLKIPLFGYVLKRQYITVNRAERADRNKSIEIMKRSLDSGISVYLCPEGTRNRKKDPPLLDFRDGAFRLAIATQRPIAVLTVMNTGDKLSPARPLELAPGVIHATWHKPIETKGMTEADLPALKERVREIMIKNIEEYRRG